MTPSKVSPERRAVSIKRCCGGAKLGLTHQLEHAEHAVQRRPDLVAHIGQELRFGPNRPLQFYRPLLDPRFERRIQLAQLLLGLLLRRMPGRQCIGHFVERRSETADFRRAVFEARTGFIIPVAPFGGDAEQAFDRPADEIAAAGPGRVNRRQAGRRGSARCRAAWRRRSRAKASAFDWPALRKKSFGGKAGGT